MLVISCLNATPHSIRLVLRHSASYTSSNATNLGRATQQSVYISISTQGLYMLNFPKTSTLYFDGTNPELCADFEGVIARCIPLIVIRTGCKSINTSRNDGFCGAVAIPPNLCSRALWCQLAINNYYRDYTCKHSYIIRDWVRNNITFDVNRQDNICWWKLVC